MILNVNVGIDFTGKRNEEKSEKEKRGKITRRRKRKK